MGVLTYLGFRDINRSGDSIFVDVGSIGAHICHAQSGFPIYSYQLNAGRI